MRPYASQRLMAGLVIACVGWGCKTPGEPGETTEEPTATQLVIRTQPGNATSAVALGTQPVVEIQDASGAVVTSENTTIVAAAIATGGGTLGGAASITAASGVVSFTDLAISGLVGNRTLTFSAAGLTSATSDAFELRPGPVSATASTVVVSSPTVAPGGTVTLTLIARDAEGNQQQAGGSTVTFTATGGSSQGTIGATVDHLDGAYTAVFTATEAGTAVTIGATVAGNAVTSQLPTIIVVQPAGASVLVSEDFEDDDFAARGWYDMRTPQTSVTEHIDGSVRSLEMHFNQGETSVVGSLGRHLFDETATVYLSYWVKYSDNWVGSQTSSHPHEFFFLSNRDGAFVGPNGASFSLLIEQNHNRTNGMVPRVGTRGRWMLGSQIFTDAPGPWYKNDWHFVEVLVQMNSAIGVADGVVQYWLDGDLIVDADDVLMRTQAGEENMLFNQLLIGSFIGGPGGSGSPEAQTWWIDDLTVATGRTTGP